MVTYIGSPTAAMDRGHTAALALAAVAGAFGIAAAAFHYGKAVSEKRHALDFVEVLTSGDSIAVDGQGHVLHAGPSEPHSRRTSISSPDSSHPDGDVLVAGQVADPTGTAGGLQTTHAMIGLDGTLVGVSLRWRRTEPVLPLFLGRSGCEVLGWR